MATPKRKRQDDAASPDSKRQKDLPNQSYAQSPIATDVNRYERSSTNIQQTELQPAQSTTTVWRADNGPPGGGARPSLYTQQHPVSLSTASASGIVGEGDMFAAEHGTVHGRDVDTTSAMDLEEAWPPLQDLHEDEDVEMQSEASYAPTDNQSQNNSGENLLSGLSPQQLNELRQFFLAIGGSSTNG